MVGSAPHMGEGIGIEKHFLGGRAVTDTEIYLTKQIDSVHIPFLYLSHLAVRHTVSYLNYLRI